MILLVHLLCHATDNDNINLLLNVSDLHPIMNFNVGLQDGCRPENYGRFEVDSVDERDSNVGVTWTVVARPSVMSWSPC